VEGVIKWNRLTSRRLRSRVLGRRLCSLRALLELEDLAVVCGWLGCQYLDETLTFTNHKRSEVRRRTDY
jgi:hypothetical protein